MAPPSKISPPTFFEGSCYKDAFLSKVHPPIYAIVHACGYVQQKAPRKHHCARGGTKPDTVCCLHKQVHDKRGVVESLALQFIAHGHIFERLKYNYQLHALQYRPVAQLSARQWHERGPVRPASCICSPQCLSPLYQSQPGLHNNPESHPCTYMCMQKQEQGYGAKKINATMPKAWLEWYIFAATFL